jgi:3-deoxy-manno-octulosonate cytidylyltransferase (CMP-KDO synthetase)
MALGKENVYAAIDDDGVRREVEKRGFQAIMTPSDLLTGTDRVACAAESIPADIYVNIQGDEPLLDPNSILKVVELKKVLPGSVVNAMAKVLPNENVESIHLPKVVFNEQFHLVYISRLPVPGSKQGPQDGVTRYKQVCIYAFNREQLDKFKGFGRKSVLEQVEDIEILRFMDLGISIHMCEVAGGSLAVDVPEDVNKVEIALKKMRHV